jgi:hypothetical protein
LGFPPKPFTASQLTRRDLVCHFPAIALALDRAVLIEVLVVEKKSAAGEAALILPPREDGGGS